MSSQGPNSPSTGADDAGHGTVAWTNPGNVTVDDANFATAILNASAVSHYLKATGFGFSIPAATINGIVVEWKRSTSTGTINDSRSRIVKGGTIGATDKASATTWPGTQTYESYGGVSDLWGESWSASDINAANFGAALAAVGGVGSPNGASLGHARITVHFTEELLCGDGDGDPSLGAFLLDVLSARRWWDRWLATVWS